jgi:hypothetical protein
MTEPRLQGPLQLEQVTAKLHDIRAKTTLAFLHGQSKRRAGSMEMVW